MSLKLMENMMFCKTTMHLLLFCLSCLNYLFCLEKKVLGDCCMATRALLVFMLGAQQKQHTVCQLLNMSVHKTEWRAYSHEKPGKKLSSPVSEFDGH